MTSGMGAAFFWALETLLLNRAISAEVLAQAGPLRTALLAAAVHDLCSAVFLLIFLTVTGRWRELIPALRSEGGLIIILAALLGGPAGMTSYLLAIRTAGASVAATLSALYPAVGAMLASALLGERLWLPQKGGLIICVGSGVLLGLQGGFQVEGWQGLIPALLCALCWGAEAVLSSVGMEESGSSFEVAIALRQLTSAAAYWLLLIPLSGTWQMLPQLCGTFAAGWLPLAALAGTMSYLCYYRAIRNLGPSRGMALNITYTVWVVLLSALLLWTAPGAPALLCAGLVSLGSALTAWDPTPGACKGVER